VPRAPWRRRNIDSPGPAGRRWTGRLRRSSGNLARRALLIRGIPRRRVGATFTEIESGQRRRVVARLDRFRGGRDDQPELAVSHASVIPVSPAPMDASALSSPMGASAASSPMGASAASSPIARPASADDLNAPVPRTIPLIPGEQTVARRIKFTIANACTIASLMLGMSAIFLSMHGSPRIGAMLLIGCVACDGLDGALARKFGVASPFGAQMDSMADMCSFGIAAPVIVYASLAGTAPGLAIAVACGMIAACAAIRLARFNVSPKDGRFFSGVPTTMTAAVMGIAVLIGLHLPGLVAVAAVAMMAVAMVSGFPYAKLSRIARLPLWLFALPAIGLFFDLRATFAAIVALYLVSGPLLWLRQRNDRAAVAA
jgi:CDP-diacylglycerol--serine O-phosphatidyltransferase